MQYELYSIDKCKNDDIYFYHLSTNSIKTIFFYIHQADTKKNFIIVDNYSDNPLNYRMLKLEKTLDKTDYENMLFECKKVKYMDIFIDQNLTIDTIDYLSVSSARKETDFLLSSLQKKLGTLG